MNTFFLIFYIDTALMATIAAVTMFRFRKQTPTVKLLCLLNLVSVCANTSAYLFYKLGIPFVNVPSSIYDFAFVAIISVLYNIETGKKYERYFFSTIVIYTIFGVLNLVFIQQLAITSYNKLLSSFIVIAFAIFYFYRLMKDLPTTHLHRLPMFWFNAAFLFYHAGSMFLFAFVHYLINVLNNNLVHYWTFHNALDLAQRLVMLAGLYFYYLSRESGQSEGDHSVESST